MINSLLIAAGEACAECFRSGGRDCSAVCRDTAPFEDSLKVNNPILPLNLQLKSGQGFIASFFPPLIGLIFVIGTIGFFFMIIFGAIQWIFSGGDKGAVEQARGRISNSLIGIIILFSAFAIVNLVETFFGINILTIDIGPLTIR